MTLHKIWIGLHGLELEVVAAHIGSGYLVANPDLEVMSSRRVRHFAGPGLESATVLTSCRFTVLLQITHLLGIYLFRTSQKMFSYQHYLRKKNTMYKSYHYISYLYDYKTMENFQGKW